MISVLVPTRNRPDSVERLMTSAFETADNDVEFVFYVDNDDASSLDVISRYGGKIITGERVVLSEMWNRCAEQATWDIMMHCGDDIVFRSAHWDSIVLNEFAQVPDKILLVYGRDGFQDEKLGTHSFIHRNWVDTVGYFVPPYFSSDYNDTWLNEVAVALGRRKYVPEIYTEHMHPVAGKGVYDITHQERLARHTRDGVENIYASKQDERHADVKKLQAFIAGYNI
jgi:glycosyltransferase involved in cell wall biosynthesis